jgi:5-methylcytosine-specific restriction endonuclease McrA
MSAGSSRGAAWNKLRLQVLQRDGYTCGYCGREATEADHIISKKSGGKDELNNLIAACRTCNASKGARAQIRMPYVNTRWLTHL